MQHAVELVRLTKLWHMYSLYSCPRRAGQFRIWSSFGNVWLWAPHAKRKIKHIFDARFTVVKGSGAGQTWVFET